MQTVPHYLAKNMKEIRKRERGGGGGGDWTIGPSRIA
jgi:hypothetical protein